MTKKQEQTNLITQLQTNIKNLTDENATLHTETVTLRKEIDELHETIRNHRKTVADLRKDKKVYRMCVRNWLLNNTFTPSPDEDQSDDDTTISNDEESDKASETDSNSSEATTMEKAHDPTPTPSPSHPPTPTFDEAHIFKIADQYNADNQCHRTFPDFKHLQAHGVKRYTVHKLKGLKHLKRKYLQYLDQKA